MTWNEFKMLLAGLDAKTPLGRIVSIRAEEDREILKYFTKEQRRIRNEWRMRGVKKVPKENVEDILEQLKQAFIAMAGK